MFQWCADSLVTPMQRSTLTGAQAHGPRKTYGAGDQLAGRLHLTVHRHTERVAAGPA